VPSKFSKNSEGIDSAENIKKKLEGCNDSESYYCVFDCDKEHLKHVIDKDDSGKNILGTSGGIQTFEQYEGPAFPHQGLVPFDFDSENVQDSLDDVRKFIDYFNFEHYQLWFSGSKGFHLYIPFGYFGLEPDEKLPKILRSLAHRLKKKFPTIDTTVYNANRKFRAPNSKHPKTNLYKIDIDIDDTLEKILDLAKGPQPMINLETSGVQPHDLLIAEVSASQVSEVDIQDAGTREAPTPFEVFDGKICVQRMLNNRCPIGQRNSTAVVIINDMFKSGKHKSECELILEAWINKNGIPGKGQNEVQEIIDDVYSGNKYYNHGCQDPLKSELCSGKCPLYEKLKPEKRPNVVDAPKKTMAENEKAKQPKEMEVVDILLTKVFGCSYDKENEIYNTDGRIIKNKDSSELFFYQNAKWNHCKDSQLNRLRQRIDLAYNKRATTNKIDQTLRRFINWVPEPPITVDMFKPNPYCANFNNGTLHLIPNDEDGGFSFKFNEHNKFDFLTNKINLDFCTDYSDDYNYTNKNDLFENMIQRVFADDPDKNEKIRALAQMFGACIMPAFPHLFFLQGKPLSGKSTFCIILLALLCEENISRVQPTEFDGFNMQSMIGKLVNVVMDINSRATINDDIVKQIEDRQPIRIRIKNKDDISAPLPAVHVFGMNDIPPTREGSGAHQRRISIIRFNNIVKGRYRRDYARHVFDSNPQGVLNFAIKGLFDLARSEKGIFLNPESGKAMLDNWQNEHDYFESFLKDISSREAMVSFNEESQIKATELFEHFKIWVEVARGKNIKLNRTQFYRKLEAKGYKSEAHNGTKHFRGFKAELRM